MKLQDKTVIITGGGRGIGRGVATAFAKEGANLVITGRHMDLLEKAKKEIKSNHNVKVLPVLADNSKEEDIKQAIDKTIETYGKLDAMINNAQAGIEGINLEDYSLEQFRMHFDNGVFAYFLYMKYSFPYLKKSKGSIVNFASGTGMIGLKQYGSYASSKEAVRGLTRVAANEWGPYGINVNAICPIVMTDGMKEWAENNPELVEQTLQTIPMRRYGDAEKDVGRTCVFLCSEDAKYLTGDTIQVEGGQIMRA